MLLELEENLNVDVCIIGAGHAGCEAAHPGNCRAGRRAPRSGAPAAHACAGSSAHRPQLQRERGPHARFTSAQHHR